MPFSRVAGTPPLEIAMNRWIACLVALLPNLAQASECVIPASGALLVEGEETHVALAPALDGVLPVLASRAVPSADAAGELGVGYVMISGLEGASLVLSVEAETTLRDLVAVIEKSSFGFEARIESSDEGDRLLVSHARFAWGPSWEGEAVAVLDR